MAESPLPAILEPEALADWMRTRAVDEVECVTPDFAGIGRGKVMPTAKFVKYAPIFLPTSLFFLTITGGYPDIDDFTEYDTDADLWLRPDLGTARAVPWANDRSMQVIHDVCDREGNLVDFAPRSVLHRVLSHYTARGWRPVVAPEIEF
ncbi:MAG: glutamine synthetase, partial [Pseudomonadota bacterium]